MIKTRVDIPSFPTVNVKLSSGFVILKGRPGGIVNVTARKAWELQSDARLRMICYCLSLNDTSVLALSILLAKCEELSVNTLRWLRFFGYAIYG